MLGGGAYSTTTQGVVENIDETPQINYYNYAPNTIKVQRGSDTINFNYTPNVESTASTTSVEEYTFPTSTSIDPKYVKNIDARAGQTIAYEYVFGNTMNRSAAVNLKSIGDTTGVTVSYLWRTTPLTQGEAVSNSPAKFTCQEMANKGDTIYLYVIVSSESADIPADFTTDIVWYYGVPYDLTFTNNVTGTTDTVKLVKNQEIDETVLEIPEGYYFDAWFKDSRYSKLASASEIKAGAKLYPRYHNIPTGVTAYMTYNSTTESYTVSAGCHSVAITNTNLIIPTLYDDGVNGKALVTSIGNYVFEGCASLTSIAIPSTVTSIGGQAFVSCYALAEVYNLSTLTFTIGAGTSDNGGIAQYAKVIHTSVSTPSKITTIDGVAYYKESDSSYIALVCTDKTKTSITIDNRTTSINQFAFSSCRSLTTITIPASVTSIGERAFYSCSSLTSILVEAGNPVYDSRNNCNAIIETATNTLIQGCNTTIIPNTVISIVDNAFYYCSSITSITIPSSVTSIGSYAFQYCSRLTSITFEDPTTWYKTNSHANWENKTGGTETDVSNTTQNATWFTSTSEYYNYHWYKL